MRALGPYVVAAVLLFAAGTGDAAPPPGLTSWWPGDGNGDDTISAHNANLDGGVGFTTAVLGQGFVFDSLDDLVRVDDNADFSPGTDSFTVDAWIKTTNGADAQIIRHYECAGYCSESESASNWDLRLISHHAWGFIRDADKGGADASGGQVFQGTKAIDDGFFHHVALVRDQVAGHARLYVDGTLEADVALDAGASGALSNIDPDADPVTIGGGWLGGKTNPDPDIEFTGVIDEVHWWRNTALSGDQIAAMCTDAVTPTSTATAPAAGTVGQPITVNYTASDNAGVARVILLVRAPGTTGLTAAATDTANSGSFTYTPTAPGSYGFATSAEDASCGREAAPTDPDAITSVTAAPTTPPPTTKPPVTTPPAKPVPITQLATLPSPHVCVSRRHFPIHLKGVKGIVKAVIKLTGVPARTVKGKALGLPIDLRGLPKGKVVVRITVTTKAGKRLVGKRTYHTCANKRIVKKKNKR